MRLPRSCKLPVVVRPCQSFFRPCSKVEKVKPMPWCRSKTMVGVLRHIPRTALALAGLLAVSSLCAQQPVPITLSVVDKSGAVIAGASVEEANGPLLGRTDTNGQLTIRCRIPCRLHIEAKGFAGKFVEISANTTVQLDAAGSNEQVTVTAYRTPLGTLESPVTTRGLSASALSTTASITMDGQVRQLPGVELFRRSSSLVSNPTSQGISLRGLGSTAASRTLVTEDDVPLNDALGGWIHWEEQPELTIDRIEVTARRRQRSLRFKRHRRRNQCVGRTTHRHSGRGALKLRRPGHL